MNSAKDAKEERELNWIAEAELLSFIYIKLYSVCTRCVSSCTLMYPHLPLFLGLVSGCRPRGVGMVWPGVAEPHFESRIDSISPISSIIIEDRLLEQTAPACTALFIRRCISKVTK